MNPLCSKLGEKCEDSPEEYLSKLALEAGVQSWCLKVDLCFSCVVGGR